MSTSVGFAKKKVDGWNSHHYYQVYKFDTTYKLSEWKFKCFTVKVMYGDWKQKHLIVNVETQAFYPAQYKTHLLTYSQIPP